jgi:hypothetical protein
MSAAAGLQRRREELALRLVAPQADQAARLGAHVEVDLERRAPLAENPDVQRHRRLGCRDEEPL